MMRPTLYQLIEYVRDGETDPLVKEALGTDKRGDRRLRQARFICKMIGRQPIPKSKPEPDAIGGTFFLDQIMVDSMDLESQIRVAEQREPEPAMFERGEVLEMRLPVGEGQFPEIRRSVLRSMVPGQDLGSLTVSRKDEVIELSLESEHEFTETASGGLRIDLSDYSISMSTRFPASEPLQLWFSDGSSSSSLSDVDVLYMPESGPFIRRHTDRDGVFELPLKLAPGMLRVSGRDFAFLRIARSE